MKKVGYWIPIEKEPKSIRKGLMRLYSFKPSHNEQRPDDKPLCRMYAFNAVQGRRIPDAYMDVPTFSGLQVNAGSE